MNEAKPDDMAQLHLLALPRPPPSHVGVSLSRAGEGVWLEVIGCFCFSNIFFLIPADNFLLILISNF